MERSHLLITLGRLALIGSGVIVLGFAVAVKTDNERYGYYNRHRPAQFVTIFTGAAIALFGAIGLFFNQRSGRRLALTLFIDCCALALCWGSGIALTFQAVMYQWKGDQYIGPGGLLYTPCIVAYLAGFLVVALIVWNALSFRPCCRHAAKDSGSDSPKQADLEPLYDHSSREHPSAVSSRPRSVISGADTITYQNIDKVAQSEQLSPSYAAPSYASHVGGDRKVGKS